RDDYCKRGLTCDESSNTCAPHAMAGEACSDRDCAKGLYCDYDLAVPTCAARLSDGSECTFSAACSSGYCVVGTCGRPALFGEPCNTRAQCSSYYCSDEGECAPEPQCYDENAEPAVTTSGTGPGSSG